jgi:FixJ family two-component response regulator
MVQKATCETLWGLQALRAGAVKFLTKPLGHGVLFVSVREALDI